MTDFLAAFSTEKIDALRRAVLSGTASNNDPIAQDIYFAWDPQTEVTIRYESPDWALISLSCQVRGAPRWLSLNLGLGEGRLENGDVLGVVVEGYAPENATLKLRLRSRINGETFDSDWNDRIDLHPVNGMLVALRTFEPIDGSTGRVGFHTLIVGLPRVDHALTIRNMRLFRVPGSSGLRSIPETLASVAV